MFADKNGFSFGLLNLTGEVSNTTGGKNFTDLQAFLKSNHIDRYIIAEQVHGKEILIVNEQTPVKVSGYDGFITSEKNRALIIKTADCCPLLIYAPQKKVIAALHAGRKSTELKITAACLSILVEKFQVDPAELLCTIGPCICKNCYQIDRQKDLHYDLIAENKQQLLNAGVLLNNIEISEYCTACSGNRHFYSYRQDQTTLRNYSAIMLLN